MNLEKRKLYDPTAPNASTAIVNGKSSNVLNWDDVRFSWAYPLYKNMLANFWTPFEINMTHDAKQFKNLTEPEQESFKKIIGLLAFLDSVQTDYSIKVADYLTDSSLVALMSVLSFQEVVHNQSYSYVLSSLVPKSTQDEIFDYWKSDPILRERNEFIVNGYEEFIHNPTPETLAKSIVYDVILEGVNFYSGFAFFYNLARHQKMVSTSTMINYINRDEQLHVYLFTNLFKELQHEHPELKTEEMECFVKEALIEATELELKWFKYIIGDQVEGVTPADMEAYLKFIANKRAKQLGYDHIFPQHRTNNLKWIKAYEDVNAAKSDFFEQKSRQYAKVSSDNGFDEL
ncbi:ribonucleotide-diphosphate reductase subunit beta [Alkalihalophilus lindianensis]|uniref:Ribonucleoside-diphosphate reductase subunit beta n=1 Tax=Alkalihalophilus lindianensis TaxID=1630542 RepID=A0ABU3XEG5_9BACI|nr:ribonucleotide-diphosphate reductase subunit beta [Alkalihalophilus lindianensis]MDV2685698.1 ribonucleotide-diphosphate reductase subunit beta [Alkalihalophilus lindianensis]